MNLLNNYCLTKTNLSPPSLAGSPQATRSGVLFREGWGGSPPIMAKVEYMAPVEAIHGKLSKGDRYGFARRKKSNNKGERPNFTFVHTKRTTPVSQDEIERRKSFGDVAKATRARLMDPDQSLTDQIAFAQQTKYKTIYAYVFNQEFHKA